MNGYGHMDNNATTSSNLSTDTGSPSTLTRLPDAQVFARDPENYTAEDVADTIERLSKIVARQRKARQDDAAIAAAAANIKKTNAAARRAKARKSAPADLMENKV